MLLIGSANVINAHQNATNGVDVTLECQRKKPVTNGNPVPKSPVVVPYAYLDGHTFYIDSIGCDSDIVLTDGNGTVVYSTLISNGTTSVSLPSTLEGTFEISIIPEDGIYYFYGMIELYNF